MALKKVLPKIVKEALKDEDSVTRDLVDYLLASVSNQHSEKQTKVGLFNEIEKLHSHGKISDLVEQE